MTNPFLSIIIPVYNGASTVGRCLDSVWKQGIDDALFEVICVNDCSTDNTVSVIEEQQNEHANLRLYTNAENLRAGGSRNRGVREAKGEYILFIDADDYFHSGSVKSMLEYQQLHRLDILMGDFAREYEGTVNEKMVHSFPNREVLTGEQFLIENSVPFGPCKFFFKKSLMLEKNIFFEENVCCEDVDWTHRMVLNSTSVQYVPLLLSHVVINEQSTTANEHRALKPVGDKLYAGFRLMQLANAYIECPKVYAYLKGVASVYYSQGIVYMSAVTSSIRDKSRTLRNYTHSSVQLSFLFSLAFRYPLTFAFLTNVSAPVVRWIIVLKRRFFKR